MGLALPLITQLLLVSSTWKNLRHRTRGLDGVARFESPMLGQAGASPRGDAPRRGKPAAKGSPPTPPERKGRAYRCQGCLSPRGAMCSRLLKRKKVAAELPTPRQFMVAVCWVLGWPPSLAALLLQCNNRKWNWNLNSNLALYCARPWIRPGQAKVGVQVPVPVPLPIIIKPIIVMQ